MEGLEKRTELLRRITYSVCGIRVKSTRNSPIAPTLCSSWISSRICGGGRFPFHPVFVREPSRSKETSPWYSAAPSTRFSSCSRFFLKAPARLSSSPTVCPLIFLNARWPRCRRPFSLGPLGAGLAKAVDEPGAVKVRGCTALGQRVSRWQR